MPVLGIEGTAHTLGVGVVEDDGHGKCRVLANQRRMLRPDEGGIHPREAARHHSDEGPSALLAALEEAGVTPHELDAVAFSQGPGLGPCLRVAATMARALSLQANVPLVGVNHCVAHLEIGRGLTDAEDPVLMYASGANTQVIAHTRGRYRVFGETLDVGIGNALDKFARENGIPFPGGPEIEKQAALVTDQTGAYHPLPYTVKGMDMSFSGVILSAQRLVDQGVPFPEVCYSLQETAFAALVEVTERALAHTQKDEVVLGGGVACNSRLQEMARIMCQERGATMHCPPRPVLIDNGAMIAWLGWLQHQAGHHITLEQSRVMPYQRTDHVDVRWRAPEPVTTPEILTHQTSPSSNEVLFRGAEAVVSKHTWMGRSSVRKHRLPKVYRIPAIDDRLRDERTRDEAHLIIAARRAGVPVPLIYDAHRAGANLILERIHGAMLRSVLEDDDDATAKARLTTLGTLVARLHNAGLTHGDLTTSNIMVPKASDPSSMVLIDFGLGQSTMEAEPRGVDLHLLEEALEATEARAHDLFAAFLEGYQGADRFEQTLTRLEDIRERGRYR